MAISPYDQETRQRAVRLYLNCSEYLGMVVDYLSSQPRVSESLCVRLSSRRSFTDNDYGVTEEKP